MPELPDLEVFSTNLEKALSGKKVVKVAMPVFDRSNVSEAVLKEAIEGQKIQHVYRDGKQLRIAFSNTDILGLHLMLNGNLFIVNKKPDQKNTILEIWFDDGKGLVMSDPKKLAAATLNPEPASAPDALSDEMNLAFLKKVLQTRKAIKALLLDQKIVRGIGNAYADEILWDARIAPFSISNKIPEAAIEALAISIKKVLNDAVKNIRKTHPDIIRGEVRDFLLIHNPNKEQSPTGTIIKTIEVGQRTTYYTDEQELYK